MGTGRACGIRKLALTGVALLALAAPAAANNIVADPDAVVRMGDFNIVADPDAPVRMQTAQSYNVVADPDAVVRMQTPDVGV
jgi:hypothetical protein